MSEHLPTGAEAHRKFDYAKRQAVVEGLVALVRGKPGDLLPFDDVQRKLGLHITRERGLQQTPLEQIVGSVGKYRDFTRSFWPRNEKLRERWKWLYVAAHDFRGLPPVELYQVSTSSRTATTASPSPGRWAARPSKPTSSSTSARRC